MAITTRPDSTAEITKYRQRLAELYDMVEAAIRQVEPGAKFARTSFVQINEEVTGPYTVPTLEVSIPGKTNIRLVPEGIYLIGARGRVDARSRLGTEILVWVEEGGPAVKMTAGGDDVDTVTRPVFPGVPEGWAWTDNQRVELVPLTNRTLLDCVLPRLIG